MKNQSVEIEQLNWEKVHELIPAIIQDWQTLEVLMLGYMDRAALQQTYQTGKVTFYSRTKQRLWVKGETSGNELELIDIVADCDNDALLVRVKPSGPCCHLATRSCFNPPASSNLGVLAQLENVIAERAQTRPVGSYTSQLFAEGVQRIAQKVGEEGLEVALAAVSGERTAIINEIADLFFHVVVLLRQCNINLVEVLEELQRRMR